MLFNSKAVVNGPTPPETGVIYFILNLISLESTLTTILLPPFLLIPTSIIIASV